MIYVISDLHGYPFEEFMKLLKNAGFGRSDFLYILGDVIDRGEDGVKYLRWLTAQPNAQLILGNHEIMMLSCSFLFEEITQSSISNLKSSDLRLLSNWQSNGAQPTLDGMQILHHSQREGILEYLNDAPLYEIVKAGGRRFLLTHSGLGNFSADKQIEDYDIHDLVWNRPALSDRYYDDIITVFGHTPTFYLSKEHAGKPLFTDTWIDIDVGAGCGYKPVLLRLDDMQEFTL